MKKVFFFFLIPFVGLMSCTKVASKGAGKVATKVVSKNVAKEGAEKTAKKVTSEVVIKETLEHSSHNLMKQGIRVCPKTGVAYVEKSLGGKVFGNIAKFEFKARVKLPKELKTASKVAKYAYCMYKLKEQIEKDPDWAAKNFNAMQIAQIEENKVQCISGYVWHPSDEDGVILLVESGVHAKTPHTDGDIFWIQEKLSNGNES